MKRFAVLAVVFLLLTGQRGAEGGGALMYAGCMGVMWATEPLWTEALQQEQDEERERQKQRRIEQLKLAAEQGDSQAQFGVGVLSEPGSEEARNWFERAARQNHAEAQYEIGRMSETEEEALKWFCLSAIHGYTYSYYRIARSYSFPFRPFLRDLVQAYKWHALAMSSGIEDAERCLNDISAQMTPAEIAEAERLVRAWKPDPSSCEVEAYQATGGA